jgi:hypothetical protein
MYMVCKTEITPQDIGDRKTFSGTIGWRGSGIGMVSIKCPTAISCRLFNASAYCPRRANWKALWRRPSHVVLLCDGQEIAIDKLRLWGRHTELVYDLPM